MNIKKLIKNPRGLTLLSRALSLRTHPITGPGPYLPRNNQYMSELYLLGKIGYFLIKFNIPLHDF